MARIAMNEIPFAPVDAAPPRSVSAFIAECDARLSDVAPPVEPPAPPLPTKRPVRHRLIGWRHDGGILDNAYETLEGAQAAGRELHYAVYWKYAIQCGRDMVERHLIEEPVS